MAKETIRRIIELVTQAQELAHSLGIPNLLQPGLVKEMIIAEQLGHELIISKRDADACDPTDSTIKYEYLSCKEGGSGQLDRMFKTPPEKQTESLSRITRNRYIYFAIFYKHNQIKLKAIDELEPANVRDEAIRKLNNSVNTISHIGFSISWAMENGRIVFEDHPPSNMAIDPPESV